MDASEMRKKIGQNIKFYRMEQKLTQEEFAEKVNLSQHHLSSIERGDKSPRISTLIEIINALGITPNHILGNVVNADINLSINANELTQIISTFPLEDQTLFINIIKSIAKWKNK